ncbi:MAG TPA: ATP-binding protein [Actinomycetota bacterium]|nr:ATP-binding protein [Actinomycetota bacterium]
MNTLSVPFHFTTTFVVAVGAFAGLWLAISRPRFAPKGWARALFGLGWGILAVAETFDGAQIITSATDGRLLIVRSAAYLALLISLVPSALAENKLDPWRPGEAGQGAWAVSAGAVVRGAGPAVIVLWTALVALRSRLEGARRLGVAFGFLGLSEIMLAQPGGGNNPSSVPWLVGHTLILLAGMALGWWLWQAFRVSVQARFVAALVLLLIMVVAVISSTVTSVFANSSRSNAFKAESAAASFETTALGSLTNLYLTAATQSASTQGVGDLIQSNSAATLAIYAGFVRGKSDFFVFCSPAPNLYCLPLGVAADKAAVTDTDTPQIYGSPVARSALTGTAAGAVVNIGLGRPKLAVIGGAPVFVSATPGGPAHLVGAVLVGKVVTDAVVGSLSLPGNPGVTVVGPDGRIVAQSHVHRGLGATLSRIGRSVVVGGHTQSSSVSVDAGSYNIVAAPLVGSGNAVVGALLVSEPESQAAPPRSESIALFFGALAATLFAVGASMVSGARIARPIRELTAAAVRVRTGDLTARVPVDEADEIGALGEAFNQMTASLTSLTGELREAAVQESQVRDELETVLQSMSDGLIALDLSARIVTINREAQRLVGMSADRARGRQIETVLGLVDAGGAPIDLPVYRLEAGSAVGFVPSPDRSDPDTKVSLTSAPISDDEGTVRGAVVVLRDLTSEHLIDKMKVEFLSNVSHELRTPLTPIKGYADLMRRKTLPPEKVQTFLNVIVASTERMERIVNMLVDFSAMQAGNITIRRVNVSLDAVTDELVTKWRPAAPKHTFLREGFESLPPVPVDKRLFPLAVDELIDNAVKFSPDGGKVWVRGLMDPRRPDRVLVSVTDQGIGIAEAEIERIFQDFVQVDASETREFGGLGLGLAYVRRIIEAHGGELRVESTPGEGSTFTLVIPIFNVPENDGGEAPEGTSAEARPGPQRPRPTPTFRRVHSARRPPPESPEDRDK